MYIAKCQKKNVRRVAKRHIIEINGNYSSPGKRRKEKLTLITSDFFDINNKLILNIAMKPEIWD